MAKIDFGPIDELIKNFLINEIAKKSGNSHGGIKLISDELQVPSSTVSKILNNLQKPSRKFIDLILEKYNFTSISELEIEVLPEKESIEPQIQNIFKIGLDFSLSAIPVLLSIKKSPLIGKAIQIAYNLTDEHKPNFISSAQFDNYDFDNVDILNNKIESLELQDFLDEDQLDCIVLPENLIDYHYENILPVITIGNADMVVSAIGMFDSTSLKDRSVDNYLGGDDLTKFLKNKKVLYIYYQNSIAEDKFSIYGNNTILYDKHSSDINSFQKDFINDAIQILNEVDVIEKSKQLLKNELLLVVGFAPIPVLYHAELRKIDGRFQHLAFNMTSMLGEKSRTNFSLCVHHRIFDDNLKMDTLNKLCKEIKYSIKDLKEYQRLFEIVMDKEERHIYDNPLIAFGPINTGEHTRVKAAQNQRFIFNLYRFFYPVKSSLKVEEGIRLYQRALIRHFTYKSLVSLPYDFVMELLSRFNNK